MRPAGSFFFKARERPTGGVGHHGVTDSDGSPDKVMELVRSGARDSRVHANGDEHELELAKKSVGGFALWRGLSWSSSNEKKQKKESNPLLFAPRNGFLVFPVPGSRPGHLPHAPSPVGP